jgi:ferritin-like protein
LEPYALEETPTTPYGDCVTRTDQREGVSTVSTIASDTDETIKSLDGFYCANVVGSLWADAVANRLEGPAIFLLTDEMAEVSEHARAAARQLANRIGDLGGAITADPRQLLDIAPRDGDFELPDCGDVRSVMEVGGRELGVIIAAYEEFLARVRETDPVSHQLVTRLLGDETHRRADIEAALQRA